MIILNDQNFEAEVLKADLPVVVDFFATWCGPCQMAGPVLEELSREYEGKIKIGKLDVDQNQESAGKYGVMNIPTVIIFKNGKEIDRLTGFPGKSGYEKVIKSVI